MSSSMVVDHPPLVTPLARVGITFGVFDGVVLTLSVAVDGGVELGVVELWHLMDHSSKAEVVCK